nr:hypothetical protein [Sedimentibacter sp.]
MYPVTTLFQNKVKETTRTWKIQIEIQHSAGILTLIDKDLILGSMRIEENSQSGQDFSVGGVTASTFEVTIVNKTDGITGSYIVDNLNIAVDDMLQTVDWYEDYTGINFEGATIIPQVGLLLDEENDTWEYVPLGRFIVDEVDKQRNTIKIKAIDNIIELDKPYSLSSLGYPASLYQIYTNICNVADVQIGTVSFTNDDYVVDERPEGDYTLRDILSFVAQLSGSFARFNRNGALELVWYTDSGITLGPGNRFNFKPREDKVQIRGVCYITANENNEEITYLAGTDEYMVDLTDNPLLQNNFQDAISNVYNAVKDTIFTPYESSWQGNPAIQTGDKITQIDRDGNEYSTIVTYSMYKYRGAGTLAGRGLPIKAKRYTGSTNKKLAEIKRKIEKEVGDKLTSLEQAQLNVTELIANMLGGYVVYGDDAIYIADNPDINIAQKIWKWGIGGFGYSENGIEGPYTTAIAANGTIVAMLIAAHIITADMIETGILTSSAGNMAIDLDNNIMRIADNLGHNRVLLGEYEPGKFGIQIKDAANNRTLLDESGLLNSWQQNMTDNFDSNHPAKLKFYLPPNAGEFINLNLSFSLEKFRSYTDTVGFYTFFASTDEAFQFGATSNGAGGHTHTVSQNTFGGYNVSSVSDHTHALNIRHSHGIDLGHNHRLQHAVYEAGTPTNVGIKIDGVDVTSVLGGSWSGEIEISDLNVKPYVTTNGWHTIEFFMPEVAEGDPVIGRVVANIFGMIFMYAPE